jgi:hypothetical protein
MSGEEWIDAIYEVFGIIGGVMLFGLLAVVWFSG